VLPYYLHQLDRVQGAAHFEVDDATALALHRALARTLSGTSCRAWSVNCPAIREKTPSLSLAHGPATAIRAITNPFVAGKRFHRQAALGHRHERDRMRVKQDSVLRLLIVDDSVEAAEAIVSGLRNAGIAVRVARPESETDLPALLGGPLDLVIAARDARQTTLAATMQAVDASGKDIPVLMVVDTIDDNILLQAMERGVRGVVLRGRAPHLLAVVRAEWADLEARRAQRLLEAQVRETERRCDALIDSSREPIAYVHEGMHIRANQAYLEMFGFDAFEDIEGMSLLDLVAPSHVADFKTLLKEALQGRDAAAALRTRSARPGRTHFPAVMEFTPAFYEGEPCVQIVFRRQESDPELAREVEELRQRDQVTGLLNRATFLQTLGNRRRRHRAERRHHALLLVEPDHFVKLAAGVRPRTRRTT
jgi:PAS domain S-box-containing protein